MFPAWSSRFIRITTSHTILREWPEYGKGLNESGTAKWWGVGATNPPPFRGSAFVQALPVFRPFPEDGVRSRDSDEPRRPRGKHPLTPRRATSRATKYNCPRKIVRWRAGEAHRRRRAKK